MHKRQYKSDRALLLAQGKQIIKQNGDSKYIYRVTLVNLVLSGMECSEVAKVTGNEKSTISAWVKTVDEEGFEALITKKQTGRPPRLLTEQCLALKKDILTDPNKFGYNVWDGNSLSDHIKKTYQVELSVRQCQRLFHRLGFSLVRPTTLPKGKNNQEKREDFKKKRIHKGR